MRSVTAGALSRPSATAAASSPTSHRRRSPRVRMRQGAPRRVVHNGTVRVTRSSLVAPHAWASIPTVPGAMSATPDYRRAKSWPEVSHHPVQLPSGPAREGEHRFGIEGRRRNRRWREGPASSAAGLEPCARLTAGSVVPGSDPLYLQSRRGNVYQTCTEPEAQTLLPVDLVSRRHR